MQLSLGEDQLIFCRLQILDSQFDQLSPFLPVFVLKAPIRRT
jgi:hypothetical protein